MIKLPNHIDLHGFTVMQGYGKTLMYLKLCQMNKIRHAKVITGRSGKMRNEFERWMKNPAFMPIIESVKDFDNHGSFLIKIKE